ncbi:hypothetical protein N431DRAFT_562288 [Stipitochalara longipes BDJ]|nr:hypothetical protein N431DRAFT_562288 [Stipitochalara longipes BDJ]
MDPLSITATCIGLASTITRTSLVVIGFVKDVRAARTDLDTVSRELLSLKTILELLADDVNDSTSQSIPQMLQKQITGIVTNCTGVVVDIEETLKNHDGGRLNKAAKWVASGKKDVAKLQSSLEAHKSALEIALDMVTLTLAREIKADTQEILNDTSAIKEDTTQILAEIARLQDQLPRDGNHRSAGFMLERYLDNLTNYAETVCDPFLDGSDGSSPTSRPASRDQESTINEHEALLPIWPQHPEMRIEDDEGESKNRLKTIKDCGAALVTDKEETNRRTKPIDEEVIAFRERVPIMRTQEEEAWDREIVEYNFSPMRRRKAAEEVIAFRERVPSMKTQEEEAWRREISEEEEACRRKTAREEEEWRKKMAEEEVRTKEARMTAERAAIKAAEAEEWKLQFQSAVGFGGSVFR